MIGLAFSGGKDSLACFYLNKDRLHEITVLWVNTGKSYPEALETINSVRKMCQSFIEIKADRDTQNSLLGLPSDVIPFSHTEFGQNITGKTDVTIQSYFGCCYENISKPLMDKVKELGITELISGKRNDEGHVSSNKNGDVVNGVKHTHPIEDWSDADVLEYLEFHMELPEQFKFKHTSLDCYDCSAYLKDTKDIAEWAKDKHPELYAKKMIRINQVKKILIKEMESYDVANANE